MSAHSGQQRREEWLKLEAEIRARSKGEGVLTLENLRECSGLELFQKMITGELPRPPISDTLGFLLVEAERGRVVFQGNPQHRHYNPIGSVHGGVLATLCDSAAGAAVHSTLPAGVGYTTLELKVSFLRAVTSASGRLRCQGSVLSAGSRVATSQAHLYDAAGELCAHATSTCLILRPERR